MANTFTNLLPVMFAQALETLREACWMPRLVNVDHADTPAGIGDTVNMTIPGSAVVSDVTAGASAVTPPDSAPSKVSITLNRWRKAGYFLTDKEAGEIFSGIRPGLQTEAVRALANDVNAFILGKYLKVYGYAGVAGTTPFGGSNLADAAAVRKVLHKQLAPFEDRRLVLDPDAEEKGLVLLANAALTGEGATVVTGAIGRRLGFDWFMDQQVPKHTAGTITTGLAAKAATAVAAGLKTFVATTAASTGACALKTGDIVVIAGQTQPTFVLTADATQASAATDVTLAFEPALDTALVGGEAITVKATHRVNLGFNKNAFAFASRRLTSQASDRMMSIADPVSGVVLRLEMIRQNKQDYAEFDILCGAECVRPALAARLAG